MKPKRRPTIHDHTIEANLFARRAIACMVVAAAVFLVLLTNLYHLQVTGFQEFQTRSNSNRITVLPVAPNRGLIYDRNGEILAENVPVYSIEIVPEEVDDLDDTLHRLATLLELDETAVESFRSQLRRARRFPQIPFADNISEQQVARFSLHQHHFPGVSVEARLQRHYPFGELFTHVVGYVGRINRQDIERLRANDEYGRYAATRTIGKLGVERYYESILHGRPGYQTVEVNSRGRVVRTLDFTPPVPGQDIYLEVDIEVQKIAMQQLQGRRGAIVVMDSDTGGLLAMYSNPSYDANLFVHGISVQDYQALLQDPNNPLINRASQGRYPPASTIKPHMSLLGLESGLIDINTRVWDPGYYQLPGVERRFRNWRSWGHGWVDMKKAIQVSNNTYFYKLAHELGIDRIHDFMAELGFGQSTGIDIHEENAALLPSRGWKRATLNEPWYTGETLSVGIGQSFWTVTPLQLATSTNTIVTKGRRLQPRFLRAVRHGEEIEYQEPFELPPLQLRSNDYFTAVMDGMERVISRVDGTAHAAFLNAPYRAAGKTGTAQVISRAEAERTPEYEIVDGQQVPIEVDERLRDNATYIGYAPADDPQITVAIAIENVGGGGRNAAPIARRIFDFYFDYQREVELVTLPLERDHARD
ncbi:penicillin-binding protein 2 [Aliidiomarina maris]|uniref:Peptidoglycan D,D-transpeptidase MrdA n=1 Tax=Aliidiomarina maris TaxID=531312 RepID=A0A327WVC3_9GAMM|nr:penicillin-binding protein 2 [Aliidiomarina maris]RAJ96823.1 penicillin-binding protein 2 [Aliidiomarina maris]RUO24233.1 penicillin-binding protein 2 [Aliidiomarina maris]